jgi:hypothetical protein
MRVAGGPSPATPLEGLRKRPADSQRRTDLGGAVGVDLRHPAVLAGADVQQVLVAVGAFAGLLGYKVLGRPWIDRLVVVTSP